MTALQQYEEPQLTQAVAYVRLSKYDVKPSVESDDDERSEAQKREDARSEATKRQEAAIREVAERSGHHVVNVYADDDQSASEDEHGFIKPREQFDRMQRDIASGAMPNKVFYYAHDRFLRNVEEGEHVRRWAKKHGVTLICCVSGGEVKLDDENGVFQFQLNTMLGRRETAATSRRIREMFERTVIAKGTSLGGKAPFGYVKVGAKFPDGTDTRSFEVVPAEAAVVREIIERAARGETLTGIASDLNQRGVATRKGGKNGWGLTTVKAVALNGRYAKRMMHKGVDRGVSAYPEIVDEATWRQAVAVLTDPKRKKRRAARKYLLSGALLTCGKCGEPLVSRPHYEPKRVHATYSCVGANGCAGVTIAAAPVEERISAAAIAHIESSQYAAKLRRLMAKTPRADVGAKEIESRQKVVTKLFMAGKMSESAYEEAMEEAASQLAQLQVSVTGDTALAAVGRYAGKKGKLAADWPSMSLDRQQAILRSVIDHVEVVPVARRGGNVFDPTRIGAPVWK